MLSLAAVSLAALNSLSACDRDRPFLTGPAFDLTAPVESSLVVGADTYIQSAAPNANRGSEDSLQLQGNTRLLFQFDQPAIAEAVGPDSVAFATLELTIVTARVDSSGHTLRLHRMVAPWTEAGATWNCAVDAVPGDGVADCSGATAWDMSGSVPFDTVPPLQFMTPNQTGIVQLDVTADVRQFLAGTPNQGWILKKADEGGPGGGEALGSKEGGAGARLRLSLVPRTGTGDTVLYPAADARIRSTSPNHAYGGDARLHVGGGRALIRFDQATIVGAVGASALARATLEVTILSNNAQWSSFGRAVDVHRMTRAWTEAGVTWNCAADAVPGNGNMDCPDSAAWDMASGAPYLSPWTVRQSVENGQFGVLRFDVTADVQAFLTGTANHGWLIKKSLEYLNGSIELGSRDTAVSVRPRLVLSLVPQDTSRPAIPASFVLPSDTTHTMLFAGDPVTRWFRNILFVRFKPSASGQTVRAVLARHGAVIIGGSRLIETYFVRVPDPGSTLAQVDSMLASWYAETSVENVGQVMHTSRSQPEGRFPNDGPSATRSSWFGPNTVTAGFLAVRAPLAWGCETGLYAANTLRIGVIDKYFDTTVTDLRNRVHVVVQPDTLAQESLKAYTAGGHGTGIASILGGAGDNDAGIAGMIWGAQLRLYPLTTGTRQFNEDLAYMIYNAIPQAISDGVRILSISLDWQPTTIDSERYRRVIRHVSDMLRVYLQANGGSILVLSGGDSVVARASAAAWREGNTPLRFVMKGAAAMLDTTMLRSRVLVVAGTDEAGQFWTENAREGSGHIGGLTVLAAPATNRGALTIGGSVSSYRGTSFSAPMVAGAAALLWSFDSTLTPEQVTGYLVRADTIRNDGTLAVGVRPQLVVPTGGFVYQLDVYTALRLVSRERSGTPICGYPVRVGTDNVQGLVDSVVLESPGASLRSFPVPSAGVITSVSVAQGGRLIAVNGWSGSSGLVSALLSHTGTSAGALVTGAHRQMLERDTAYVYVASGGNAYMNVSEFVIRRSTGDTTQRWRPFADLPVDRQNGYGVVDPTGTRVALISPDYTGRNRVVGYVGALGSMMTEVARFDPTTCTPACTNYVDGNVVWRHDGAVAVFALWKAIPSQPTVPDSTVIVAATTGNTPTPARFEGMALANIWLSGDDAVLGGGYELKSTLECRTTRLLGTSPFASLGASTAGRPNIDCWLYAQPTIVVPNVQDADLTARSAFDMNGTAAALPGRLRRVVRAVSN